MRFYTDNYQVRGIVREVIWCEGGGGVGSDEDGMTVAFGERDEQLKRIYPVTVDLTKNRRRLEDILRKDRGLLSAVLTLQELRESGTRLTREALSEALGIK